MIDTKKPVRIYNVNLPEKERIYFYLDSIKSENKHTCTFNIKGEPQTFFILNKVTHRFLNPIHEKFVAENYEIPNFPEPEVKFTNILEPLVVNYELLQEVEKNTPTSQISAWAIENDPLTKIKPEPPKPKTLREILYNIFIGKNPTIQEEKIVPKQKFEFLYKEYWKNFKFIKENFLPVASPSKIGQHVKQIDVVSTFQIHDITMPVYRVIFKNNMEMVFYNDLGYNFFVSIISKEQININLDLFSNPSQRIYPSDCPGFKPEWIFAPYTENRKQFTTSLPNSENFFFTFLFFLHLHIKSDLK
jgi:hypothetical protein